MTSEDLGEQDRAFLARVGAVPTNRKPVSVWLAQALCVVLGILTGLSAFQRQGTSAIALGLLGLLYLAPVVGAQKRQAWARWTFVALLTLGACASALQALGAPSEDAAESPGHLHVAPNERSGAAAGRATSILLMLVLGWRLGFGDPAKRYFWGRTQRAAEPMAKPPELDAWIACLKDEDAMTYEAAYYGPRPSGDAVVPRLLQELRDSTNGFIRGKFVELLGEMGDESVVPVLIAELAHSDHGVREWAVTSLTKLASPDGLRAVSEYRATHPDD